VGEGDRGERIIPYPGPVPVSLRPLLRSLALSTSSLFSAPIFCKRSLTFLYCLDETVSYSPKIGMSDPASIAG
jgi:hypothetical protein